MRGRHDLWCESYWAQNRGEVRAAMSGEGDLGESGREVRDLGGRQASVSAWLQTGYSARVVCMRGMVVYGVNEVCTGSEWRVRKGIHGEIDREGRCGLAFRVFTARSGAGW